MKVLQINTTVNTGSTGRIAEAIGQLLIKNRHQSYIAFGRGENRESESSKIKIGTKKDFYSHILLTRIRDKHAFGSLKATRDFIKQISIIQPDIIHLHNIHGYYLHIGVLFEFLKNFNKPIVWTLHDCWPFTGHCAHFQDIGCYKWETHCYQCPKTNKYPKSWLLDNSYDNFIQKKDIFNSAKINLVVPSKWLKDLLQTSFLKDFPSNLICNGVDMMSFIPKNKNEIINKLVDNNKIILGVANIWTKNKGLNDFISLSKILPKNYKVVLIGTSIQQGKDLSPNILGINRTESVEELANWYSMATAFINPTYSDNFPTTNLEALACGTPIITYNTGGSPEAISADTGFVVNKGDINGILSSILAIDKKGKDFYTVLCRERALKLFNKDDRFQEYIFLYQKLLQDQKRK